MQSALTGNVYLGQIVSGGEWLQRAASAELLCKIVSDHIQQALCIFLIIAPEDTLKGLQRSREILSAGEFYLTVKKK